MAKSKVRGLPADAGVLELTDALAHGDADTVVDAAKRIETNLLSALEDALVSAFRALSTTRVQADPACTAKEAIVAALDALEHSDASLFAEAAAYVQRTKSKVGLRDTAARVRARGLLGVARLGHPDAALIFGVALADADASVRLAAARATAHRGARDGAGLLALRLGVGDSEPEIVRECLRGLFALAPELAGTYAAEMLRGDERARDDALAALGTASSKVAIEVLERALEDATLHDERAPIIEALGLSLRPEARRALIGLLAGDRRSDAELALQALAIHRYDPRLVAQVREATARNPELTRLVASLF